MKAERIDLQLTMFNISIKTEKEKVGGCPCSYHQRKYLMSSK
jgi:hypothetical protein